MVAVNNATGLGFVAPAIANFFRPNAPNYFLASALSGGAVTKAVLDAALSWRRTLRTPALFRRSVRSMHRFQTEIQAIML